MGRVCAPPVLFCFCTTCVARRSFQRAAPAVPSVCRRRALCQTNPNVSTEHSMLRPDARASRPSFLCPPHPPSTIDDRRPVSTTCSHLLQPLRGAEELAPLRSRRGRGQRGARWRAALSCSERMLALRSLSGAPLSSFCGGQTRGRALARGISTFLKLSHRPFSIQQCTPKAQENTQITQNTNAKCTACNAKKRKRKGTMAETNEKRPSMIEQ